LFAGSGGSKSQEIPIRITYQLVAMAMLFLEGIDPITDFMIFEKNSPPSCFSPHQSFLFLGIVLNPFSFSMFSEQFFLN